MNASNRVQGRAAKCCNSVNTALYRFQSATLYQSCDFLGVKAYLAQFCRRHNVNVCGKATLNESGPAVMQRHFVANSWHL